MFSKTCAQGFWGWLTASSARLADAEDAVQDTFLKWAKTERGGIDNAASWLTAVCTRRCLDLLRAAHRTRVSYVGAWLPEPVHTPVGNDVEKDLELASSLTTAFLLLLERLTPRERAAYLLHDIFDVPYAEIAEILQMNEPSCRKLVSRAKVNLGRAKVRHTTPREQQDRFLKAFEGAITQGEIAPLASLLSADVRLSADGGGKVPALIKTLVGKADVAAFLVQRLHEYWAGHLWQADDINGLRGFVLKNDTVTSASVSFAYDEAGRVTDIFIMRNPAKLASLQAATIN